MEYVQMTLTDWMEIKEKIRKDLQNVKHAFVRVGYNLRRIRDEEAYKAEGYTSLSEFAEKEYGLNASTVSRLIAINEKYSVDGYSEQLLPQYENFRQGSLTEMLALPDADMQMITPQTSREDIRELKRFNAAPEAEDVELEDVIKEFCRQNQTLINDLRTNTKTGDMDEKKIIDLINPSGSRTFKKGLYFISFTDSDIKVKKFGGTPQAISYTYFMGMIAMLAGYMEENIQPEEQKTEEQAIVSEEREKEIEKAKDRALPAAEHGEPNEESEADRGDGGGIGGDEESMGPGAPEAEGERAEPAGIEKEAEDESEEAQEETRTAEEEPEGGLAPAQIMPLPEETEAEKTVRKMMTLLKLIEEEIINGHYLSAEMRVDQLKTQLETMRK